VTYSSFPTQRFNLESRVVRRAWQDEAYRARLLEDPKAALEEEIGAQLPSRLQVQVVEERPDLICIVLPVDTSTIPNDTVNVMIGVAPKPPPSG
jgi:hypothetical protein